MSEHRKASFKQGIKDGTRKRDEEQSIIRKKNREQKIARQRCAGEEHIHEKFAELFPAYNRRDFTHPASPESGLRQLEKLSNLLAAASDTELERHLDKIVDAVTIQLLVALFAKADDARVMRLALGCLVNATQTADLKIVQCVFNSGFLNHLAGYFRLALEGGYPQLQSALQGDVWKALINCVFSCQEACQIILKSAIFTQGLFSAYLARLVAESNNDPAHLVLVQLFIRSLLDKYSGEDVDNFIPAAWNFMCYVLYNVLQPFDHAQMDINMQKLASFLFLGISGIFRHSSETVNARLVEIGGYSRIMHQLGALFKHFSLSDKREIAAVFASLSAMRFDSSEEIARQRSDELAEFIPFFTQLLSHTDEMLRWQAYKMAGNCIADGLSRAQEFLRLGFIEQVSITIRHDGPGVVQQAVFSLMNLFLMCDDERRYNMQTTALAKSVMHDLVERYSVFKLVVPLLDRQGQDALVLDVLTLIETGLKWNSQLCLRYIENVNGQNKVEHLLNAIQHLKGNRNTVLYNAAVRVDDLLSGKDDIDSVLAMEHDQPDEGSFPPPPPGVFRGAFFSF